MNSLNNKDTHRHLLVLFLDSPLPENGRRIFRTASNKLCEGLGARLDSLEPDHGSSNSQRFKLARALH